MLSGRAQGHEAVGVRGLLGPLLILSPTPDDKPCLLVSLNLTGAK